MQKCPKGLLENKREIFFIKHSRLIMVTAILIGFNVLVFIVMGINGASLMDPSVKSIINWGGASNDLIISGEWWRLVTCMFVHIGIIHLFLNIYALYSIGSFLEPILGKLLFFISYLVTGVLSGLCSFLYHKDSLTVRAGASGAIAGIFGVYVFILLTPTIPKNIRYKLLKSVAYVILLNFGYGLTSGINIDHSAHLGGLGSGLALGALFTLPLWLPRAKFMIKKRWKWISAGSALTLTLILVPAILINQKPSDHLIFSKLLKEHHMFEKKANAYFEGLSLKANNKNALSDRDSCILPELEKIKNLTPKLASLKLGDKEGLLRDYLIHYINLYDKKFHLMLLAYEENTFSYDFQIMQLDNEIKKLNKTYEALFQ